jgi:hypothetical protein
MCASRGTKRANNKGNPPLRYLTPSAATLADTLCALGADDPLTMAQAVHDGECLRCLTDADEYPCDGVPTLEQHILAQAFCTGLALLAIQAPPRAA